MNQFLTQFAILSSGRPVLKKGSKTHGTLLLDGFPVPGCVNLPYAVLQGIKMSRYKGMLGRVKIVAMR